jgi:hypothetical protein
MARNWACIEVLSGVVLLLKICGDEYLLITINLTDLGPVHNVLCWLDYFLHMLNLPGIFFTEF